MTVFMGETKMHTAKRWVMKRVYADLSGEERMARARMLIEEAWENMSAEGRCRFMSRNFRIRRMRKDADGLAFENEKSGRQS